MGSSGQKVLLGGGWVLLAYLVVAQGVAAIDYGLGVRMGTQEPVERITEVGVAFWWGFAFAKGSGDALGLWNIYTESALHRDGEGFREGPCR